MGSVGDRELPASSARSNHPPPRSGWSHLIVDFITFARRRMDRKPYDIADNVMSARLFRSIISMIVAAHLILVLAYTLPRGWVPDRLYAWGQRYTRPWFHQRWALFAPDPADCDRVLEVGFPDGTWRPLIPADRPYLVRRMARPLAQLVSDDLRAGRTVDPVLARAMRGLVRDIGREVPDLHFRLVERCIVDPGEPAQRMTNLFILDLPVP